MGSEVLSLSRAEVEKVALPMGGIVAAVAAKSLARRDAEHVTIIGCGVQGRSSVDQAGGRLYASRLRHAVRTGGGPSHDSVLP